MNEANTLTKTEFDYEIPKFNPGIIVKEKELSSEELSELFTKVCDKVHWKNEIKAEIPAKDLDKYNQAVSHYTGGILDVVTEEDDLGLVWVYGEGYYYHIGS